MYELKKRDLNIGDIDQSSFELSNLVMEYIKQGCICQQAKLTKNSEAYENKLLKKKMISYQHFLNFKVNMNENEKIKYSSNFINLQILLHSLRSLYLGVYYNCDFCNEKRAYKKKIEKNKFQWKNFISYKISDEEFNSMINNPTVPDFDTFLIEDFIKSLNTETDFAFLPSDIINKIKEINENVINQNTPINNQIDDTTPNFSIPDDFDFNEEDNEIELVLPRKRTYSDINLNSDLSELNFSYTSTETTQPEDIDDYNDYLL